MQNTTKSPQQRAWVTMNKINKVKELFATSPVRSKVFELIRSGVTPEQALKRFHSSQVTFVVNVAQKHKLPLKGLKMAEKPVKVKPVKASKYADDKERPNKSLFKNFWLEVISQAKVRSGLLLCLPNMFQTEMKILRIKALDNIKFVGCEYKLTGLAGFRKKQSRFLNGHPVLASRFITDIFYNKMSNLIAIAAENQYVAIDADYCGELRTLIDEISLMLSKKMVVKGGHICLTFRATSRKVEGYDAVDEMQALLKKFPQYKLVRVPLSNSRFHKYSDGAKGAKMIGCILQRVR